MNKNERFYINGLKISPEKQFDIQKTFDDCGSISETANVCSVDYKEREKHQEL